MARFGVYSSRIFLNLQSHAVPHPLQTSLSATATASFLSTFVSDSPRSLHSLPCASRHSWASSLSYSLVSSHMHSPLLHSNSSSRFSIPAASHVASSASSASTFAVAIPSRSFVTSRPLLGLEEFFTNQQAGRTGRMWRCSDLRVKSFSDLQKLWYVLLKERNMLLTYRQQCTVTQTKMANPERLQKVKKSMAHIKMVLGERHREVRERTEEADSDWRKKREEKRRKRAVIKKQENRRAALPKQVHRQKERHPKRKKIKFRGLRPRTTTGAQQPSQSVEAAEGVGQEQSAA